MTEKHTPAPRGPDKWLVCTKCGAVVSEHNAEKECKGRVHVAQRADSARKQHVDALMGISQRFVDRIGAMRASVADDAEHFCALHMDYSYLRIALQRGQRPWLTVQGDEYDEALREMIQRLEDAWTAFHARCFPGDA